MITSLPDHADLAAFTCGWTGWPDDVDPDLFVAIVFWEAEKIGREFAALERLLPFLVDGADGKLRYVLPEADPIPVARAVLTLGWDRDGAPDSA